MTRHIVLCAWDGDGKNPSYRYEPDADAAAAAVARIQSENPEVFAIPDPGTDPVFMVVDPVNKTVSHDTNAATAAENALALKIWQFRIAANDKDMARLVEDILNVSPEKVALLPQTAQDKYNARKLLRSQKP